MLNMKVSKHRGSEASKNQVVIKHISRLSKSKYIINPISLRILQKSTLQKSHIILN